MTPAQIVKKARMAAKMDQSELADKLGCSLNTVSRWSLGNGSRPMRIWCRSPS